MIETTAKKTSKKNKWKTLCLSLKYRPKIMKLILKMRQTIRRRNAEIKSLKTRLLQAEVQKGEVGQVVADNKVNQLKEFKHSSTQTLEHRKNKKDKNRKKDDLHMEDTKRDLIKEEIKLNKTKSDQPESEEKSENVADAGWNIDPNRDNEKSIAEQVKEVAQSALQQTGMVYVESAGMYYDYKTGYYYNSELGLYYHTDTGCYYYFSDEKQTFVFHSYPDTSAVNTSLIAHQKKKARKLLKRERKHEDNIHNLTKKLSQDSEDGKAKRRKIKKPKKNGLSKKDKKSQSDSKKQDVVETPEAKNADDSKQTDVKLKEGTKETETADDSDIIVNKEVELEVANEGVKSEKDSDIEMKSANEENKMEVSEELEDGECSESSSEEDDDDSASNASTATISDEDSIAKHHPPCMRVIVRETDLPKLKVGSLFLITKDGGTIGREGDHHMIVIKDTNVSRNHLDVRYDMNRKTYVATDLGSKNGTILNGNRMSESSEVSSPMDILHGSTIQLGETKLLCHIHPGNDTCGHCEPGLLMESEDKEKKVAYTRNCSVKKQHELELARLKNIYAPKLLAIEEKPYNDRAQARRETVGSSHDSVKTESTDLDTSISTENKGFKLLQKMGWSEGEGLGKDNQGDTEPVPLVSNEGKAGLGTSGAVGTPTVKFTPRAKNMVAGTLRLASRTKMLQPPAKAFYNPDDEESE